MYLEHFNLKDFPFTLAANTDYFCNLSGHQAALNVVLLSLQNGETFIKIVGEVGTGKTLLSRLVMERLDDNFFTAYIPNPCLSPAGLRKALFCELGVKGPVPRSQHVLLIAIQQHLINLHQAGKRVVLIIDEAQSMSQECLETLRLLTNFETNATKLLQVVLFGQPELDMRLNKTEMRQLKQRISFSYYLPAIQRTELEAYLCHRLAMAGHTRGSIFTKRACSMLYRKSGGLPRLINILCHKAMMAAYGYGTQLIEPRAMRAAIRDTDYDVARIFPYRYILIGMLIMSGVLAGFKYQHNIAGYIQNTHKSSSLPAVKINQQTVNNNTTMQTVMPAKPTNNTIIPLQAPGNSMPVLEKIITQN